MSLSGLSGKIRRKSRKRVGRGNGSGHGTYSCKGGKGQTARSGGNRRPGFEGGQTPYLRKLPKYRGFKNPNYQEYQVVNIGQLNIFDDKSIVDSEALHAKNLISKKSRPVKLLGGKGTLEKSLTIKVDKASKKAVAEVEAKKGQVQMRVTTTRTATTAEPSKK